MDYVLLILGILAVWTLWMMYRNECVHRYRMELLDDIQAELEDDLDWRSGSLERLAGAGQRLDDTYAAFNSVSYNTMVLQFWRPLNTFYKDEWFAGRLRPGERRQPEVRDGAAGQDEAGYGEAGKGKSW
jgi:hypothetical protein